jgi:hypothetical protein
MLLFVLAAGVRVQALDLAPFGMREAAELDRARALAASRGLSEWLLPSANPGLATQIHALTLRLSDRPATWTAALALVDAVTVVVISFAARSLAGRKVAAIASALYAVSPWAWLAAHDAAPRALPVLVAVGLLASVSLVRRGRLRDAILLGLVGGLLLRVGPSQWSFIVPVVVTLALTRCPAWSRIAGALTCGLVGVPALLTGWATRGEVRIDPMLLSAVGDGPNWVMALGRPELTAFACASVLALGGTLLAIRGWRERSPQLVLPLLWVVAPAVPLVAFAMSGLVAALPSLLPAGAILLSLPAAPGGGRRPRWIERAGLAVSMVLLGVTAWGLTRLIESDEGSVAAPALPILHADRGQDLRPTLRFWQAVADATGDSAQRVGTGEVTILAGDGPFADSAIVSQSLVGDEVTVRTAPSGTLHLPLDREAIYLLPPGTEARGELLRPAARLAAIPADGTDATLRIVSLRPRATGGDATTVKLEDGRPASR